MTSTGFLQRCALLTALLLVSTALFCALVDPFCLFPLWQRQGWNTNKFSYFMREGLIKPYQIRQQSPEVVLLGNSVANTGFTLSPAQFAGKRAYSMGMAGMGIDGNYRTLQNLDPDLQVLWVIDFWNFFGTNTGNDPAFLDNSDFGKRLRIARDGTANHGQIWQQLKDIGLLLLSREALTEALLTLRNQNKEGWHLQADGSWAGDPPRVNRSQQKAFQYMENVLLTDLAAAADLPSLLSTPAGHSSLDSYAQALSWLHAHHTNATLIIPPTHARWLEVMFVRGHWPVYRQWKQRLVALNESLAAQYGRPPLPIHDFSGYNSHTTEPVPEREDRQTHLRYFRDGVHFSRELGANILAAIFVPAADNSGIRLDNQTVEPQLQALLQGHWRYTEQQPQQWQDVYQRCLAVFARQPDACFTLEQQRQRNDYH